MLYTCYMKKQLNVRIETEQHAQLKEIAEYINLDASTTVESMIKTVHGSMKEIQFMQLPISVLDVKTKSDPICANCGGKLVRFMHPIHHVKIALCDVCETNNGLADQFSWPVEYPTKSE